jgi:hypothetical protein
MAALRIESRRRHNFFWQFMRARKTILFVLSLGWLFSIAPGLAQVSSPSEYQIKAAFLFNFVKFIDWPPEAFADEKGPFIIGILGDNPFGNDLERTVAGKIINDRPITVQVFHTSEEATHCQILFISSSEKKHFPEIIKSFDGAAILTVSDTDRFIEAGGMVNFVKEASKIRFQINSGAAKAARLKISSKLLSLAIPSLR